MEFHGFTTGVAIIAGGIVAALVLVAVVRSLFEKDLLQESHDITGNLLSVCRWSNGSCPSWGAR